MSRVYNFSAGPAVLPVEVLQEAADEMLDYRGTGMSVMEMSHRSKAFDNIIKEAEADLRKLMNIPDNYKVLFLQGVLYRESLSACVLYFSIVGVPGRTSSVIRSSLMMAITVPAGPTFFCTPA